jgi:hypothetical protein
MLSNKVDISVPEDLKTPLVRQWVPADPVVMG